DHERRVGLRPVGADLLRRVRRQAAKARTREDYRALMPRKNGTRSPEEHEDEHEDLHPQGGLRESFVIFVTFVFQSLQDSYSASEACAFRSGGAMRPAAI